MTASLPASPSLEHLRNQAKDLLKAARTGAPESLSRFRAVTLPDARQIRLSDAQLVIAREYGFPSWPRLKRYVDEAQGRDPKRHRPFQTDISYYDDRAAGLLSVHRTGQMNAIAVVRARHPRYRDLPDDEIRSASLTHDDARLILAREHGFESWADLARHVKAMADGRSVEPFHLAFQAIEEDDSDRLRAVLRLEPSLVNAQGTNGNTLLNLAASLKRVNIARLLLESGANVNLPNNKGWTPVHQAAYMSDGSAIELLRLFLDAGGRVYLHAHGDGGTPLVQALFWGNRVQAEMLAGRGIVPDNLRVAAGLGRAELMAKHFLPDGSLAPTAGQHREFHRPHSGFPEWQPSNDPHEILDEALVWACMNGRVEALGFLVESGADVNSDPYRGTPLTRAACKGHLDVMRWLLEHGADPNRRGTFGGPSHGQGIVALHIVAQNGEVEPARILLQYGADPTIEDDLYHSSPIGWANHFGHEELAKLMQRG